MALRGERDPTPPTAPAGRSIVASTGRTQPPRMELLLLGALHGAALFGIDHGPEFITLPLRSTVWIRPSDRSSTKYTSPVIGSQSL